MSYDTLSFIAKYNATVYTGFNSGYGSTHRSTDRSPYPLDFSHQRRSLAVEMIHGTIQGTLRLAMVFRFVWQGAWCAFTVDMGRPMGRSINPKNEKRVYIFPLSATAAYGRRGPQP